MKLHYLTCCLLGLSAAGCSQHFVQSPQKSEQIQQRTVHAVNAIYENTGFDFQGNIKFDVQKQHQLSKKNPELNQDLKDKLNRYLSSQKISLSTEQRQQLEQALLQQQVENGEQKWSRMLTTGFNFLQDFQVKYQGGVDYRDQVGAINLTAAYHTPTLQMQMTYPMLVDLKQAKFYSNGFALFPFLAPTEQRDQLMYLDFSKYKKQLGELDLKTLITYIKQNNALPYILATPEQLTHVSLTAADRQQGIVEKIQLKTSLEEYLAQTFSYNTVNLPYLAEHMKKAEQAKTETVDLKSMSPEQQADWAYDLVKDHIASDTIKDGEQEAADPEDTAKADATEVSAEDELAASEDENTESAEDSDALSAANSEDDEESSEQDELLNPSAPELSEAQCQDLQKQPKTASIGQYKACLDEKVDLFAVQSQGGDAQLEKQMVEKSQGIFKVVELFKADSSPQFKTADEFKTLWQAKQPQVQQLLAKPAERNPLIVEIGIDRQGRAITTNYQLELTEDLTAKKLVIHSDNQWSNYGHPKNIDREGMRKAKSFDEAAQGTVLQDKVQKFKRLLGQANWDEQIQELANQSYAQNHSYLKTYQLVYGLLLSLNYPQIMQHYSAQDIQEIALVMAYYDGRDDQSFAPKGQQLVKIKQLIEKHQLSSSMFYKVDAASVVKKAQAHVSTQTQWAAIQKSSTNPATRFARLYEVTYLAEHRDDQANPDLTHLSNRLGQFYVESRKKSPNFKVIEQASSPEHEYLDADTFKSTYLQMLKSTQAK